MKVLSNLRIPDKSHSPSYLLLALAVTLSAGVAGAQVCEPPLFVVQSSGGANVMILCDNSGSMNEPMKLPRLKSALGLRAERLMERDRISVVEFNPWQVRA